MSQEKPKTISFQEYYSNIRGNVIVSYDNAKELALKALDDLAQKYAESMQQQEVLKTALKDKVEKVEKPLPVKTEKKLVAKKD